MTVTIVALCRPCVCSRIGAPDPGFACAQTALHAVCLGAVLTPVACIVQVNLSTLLTGLGDGSLLCPTTSALGATVARSDAYDSAMQELARVQTENVNLRAEVDCLVHVRAENVSLRAEVHRAHQQVKRSTQSVLVELDNMSTASETMQARAEHEQQLKLQQAQLQHERNMEAATADATAQLCMHSDRTAAAQAHSSQLTAQLQARVAALEQECVVLRVKLTDAVERRHSDVPTFDFLCADGQATQRADGTHLCGKRWNNLPGAAKVSDNYSCAYLEEDAPRWVDDRVREADLAPQRQQTFFANTPVGAGCGAGRVPRCAQCCCAARFAPREHRHTRRQSPGDVQGRDRWR